MTHINLLKNNQPSFFSKIIDFFKLRFIFRESDNVKVSFSNYFFHYLSNSIIREIFVLHKFDHIKESDIFKRKNDLLKINDFYWKNRDGEIKNIIKNLFLNEFLNDFDPKTKSIYLNCVADNNPTVDHNYINMISFFTHFFLLRITKLTHDEILILRNIQSTRDKMPSDGEQMEQSNNINFRSLDFSNPVKSYRINPLD